MAKQTAWVIGLGVPGAVALFVPPSVCLRGTARRRILLLAAIGAAMGYALVAIIDHFTTSPIAAFGAASGAIVVPGLYLALLAVERGEYMART
jgi:hypothetical protein